MAQSETITGTITDENNESVIGCSVILKGKTIGAITDIDGNFTLQVDPGDILVVSYIGYKTQEIKIEPGKKHYNITLENDKIILSESIVIAYGTVTQSSKSSTVSLAKSPYDYLPEEEYTAFGENKFKSPLKEPLSTFSADVDTASYTNIHRFLNKGLFPPRDAIRTEELDQLLQIRL
jgi:Ca-activated chloride channel family protein